MPFLPSCGYSIHNAKTLSQFHDKRRLEVNGIDMFDLDSSRLEKNSWFISLFSYLSPTPHLSICQNPSCPLKNIEFLSKEIKFFNEKKINNFWTVLIKYTVYAIFKIYIMCLTRNVSVFFLNLNSVFCFKSGSIRIRIHSCLL